EELEAAQANLVRGLPHAFATNDAIVDTLADLAAAGLEPVWFDGYATMVRATSAAAVQRAARTLLDRAHLVLVIVGPLGELRADLARLGFGRPVELDADGTRIATK